jgi:hypothetical protein
MDVGRDKGDSKLIEIRSNNTLWSQYLFWRKEFPVSVIVSDMTPQREGHGEPPNVILRATRRKLLKW